MMHFIDTHCHLDGDEFAADRDAVVQRAREAGCTQIFLPAIDVASCKTVLDVCAQYPDYCYPMLGLHPEEVKADWRQQLDAIHQLLQSSLPLERAEGEALPIAHCRKAQNEMVAILKRYARELPGGVFHCFTGNEQEARQLLNFDRFVLGIGGVLTFKKSHLPEVLPACVPLDRLVLETDAPYMAPVPMRGQRNESAFIRHVITRLAEAYGVSEEEICRQTTATAERIFRV